MYHKKFLRLCGFEEEEIKAEGQRVQTALSAAGIGSEDIGRAEERIKQLFDVQSPWVRKGLGIWLKQFVNTVLAKKEGKTLVYTHAPTDVRINQLIGLASENIQCTYLETVISMVMGSIFDKLTPILEAGDQYGLPTEEAGCSYHRVALGAWATGIVPKADMVTCYGAYCDQGPKTVELLHELYGVPYVIVDGCLDFDWNEYGTAPERRLRFITEELTDALDEVRKVLGISITQQTVRAARMQVAMFHHGMDEVWSLMKADPQPASQADLSLFCNLMFAPERKAIQEAIAVLPMIIRDLKSRVAEGRGVVEKGAPKVVWLTPSWVDPTQTVLPERSGLSVIMPVFYYIAAHERIGSTRPTQEERLVESYIRWGINQGTEYYVSKARDCCRELKPDGVLWNCPYNCRASMGASLIAKSLIERELNIPVLVLESDWYDNRQISTEALRTRVETFSQILKAKKIAKEG